MQLLIQYVLTAMLAWAPPRTFFVPYGETEDQARARLAIIAEDIVTVAMDVAEPPVFTGNDGRLKTVLLQASIASLETSFQRFVDDGTCNKPGYGRHADRRGDCDGGHAWSFWQIHIFGGGYILLDDGTLGSRDGNPAFAAAHPERVLLGPQLVADRRTALRVAQRLERMSMHGYHSLCSFTGEPCEDGRHPKAVARFDRAKKYLAEHPFTETLPSPVTVITSFAMQASENVSGGSTN